MKIATYIALVACLTAISGCKSKQVNLPSASSDTLAVEVDAFESDYKPDTDYYEPIRQSINLFWLRLVEDKDVAFVSLSDIYYLSDHPDSTAVPDVKEKGYDAARYFKLEPEYRKRFLSKTGVTEADTVYVYDYTDNHLALFAVKELDVVAVVNNYAGTDDWPFSQYEYMIGFEIAKSRLKGFRDYPYAYNVLVYVGSENPFAQEPLIPISWSEIAAEEFPSKEISDEYASCLSNTTVGGAHLYETDSLRYFLQDYLDSYGGVYLRRLLVVESKTENIVIEKIFGRGEGTSPAPLNSENEDIYSGVSQWTGKLFKEKPPVVFGFEYISFGCPFISILDTSNEDIYISCDNRH